MIAEAWVVAAVVYVFVAVLADRFVYDSPASRTWVGPLSLFDRVWWALHWPLVLLGVVFWLAVCVGVWLRKKFRISDE